MNRRATAAAVLGIVLAIGGMLWISPDTGADPAVAGVTAPAPTASRVAPARPRAAPTRPAQRPPSVPPTPIRDSGGPPRLEHGRPPVPPPPIVYDHDRVYDADLGGLTHATMARRDELQGCWQDFGGLDLPGRFTLQVTVSRGEDGGEVDATVVNGDASAALHQCVSDVMSDAAFPSPESQSVSMVVPLPVPDSR